MAQSLLKHSAYAVERAWQATFPGIPFPASEYKAGRKLIKALGREKADQLAESFRIEAEQELQRILSEIK